jgi:membrane protein implicated in regulation of membrane protease activity
MDWWIWLLFGFVLLAAEIFSPGGFYLLFFGCAALLIGLLAGLGWAGPVWVQGILFSVFSVLSLLLFRRRLLERFRGDGPGHEVDSLVGQTAFAVDRIAPNCFGKVELRGTAWNARNVGEDTLAAKQRARVEKVDGLTLCVRKEQRES